MPETEKEKIMVTVEQASAWAESCLRINHLNTLIQREITQGTKERARELSERARTRAWTMFNELVAAGAKKPEGFCEPDDATS